MQHHREEWTNQTHDAVVIDMEDGDSENEDSVTLLLIYLEESNDTEDESRESMRNLPSADPTT